MTETEYICNECGEEWDGKSSIGYVQDVCANCGTIEHEGKREK